MRAVLVDDEENAMASLAIMLNEFMEGIEIVGMASSTLEAIKLINAEKPDVVFLDIKMPHGSGFDVLEASYNNSFQVIVTTAYHDYAIEAIKANAIDYLLKPIDIDELTLSVEKAKGRLQKSAAKVIDNSSATSAEKKLTRIPISVHGSYVMVELEDIQYIKGEGAYSEVNTFDKKYMTSKNLGYYEELLSEYDFLRVNNSYVVNTVKITQFLREDGGKVILQNKVEISVSRNRKGQLKKVLNI